MGISILTVCLDQDNRGIVVKDLELGKILSNAVVDIVVQTTRQGQKVERGTHYHPKCASKVEIFVPLAGEAYLQWHETAKPKTEGMLGRKGISC